MPSSAPVASPDVLLGLSLGAELETGEDTHTHPPPWAPPLFSALWWSCSLIPDLIKTLALAQPLRAQNLDECSNTSTEGDPRASGLPPPLAPERDSDYSKVTQPVAGQTRMGAQGYR